EMEYLSIINNCNHSYRLNKINPNDFNKIPGSPIAYWLSEKMFKCFAEGKALNIIADLKTGLSTTDNDRFLRFWYETRIVDIAFNLNSRKEATTSNKRWFPYIKGGINRKWYGNKDFVVNWHKDGAEIRDNVKGASGGRIVSIGYYFKESLTWSYLSIDKFAMRYNPTGSIFDSIGTSCFLKDEKDKWYILGLLNTKLVFEILEVLAPTMAFNPGSVGKIPIIKRKEHYTVTNNLVNKNLVISKTDWDSFETSWDFKLHPLADFSKYMNNYYDSLVELGILADRAPIYVANLENAYEQYKEFTKKQFDQLKANEEELNRIFIDIYGLEDELTPEVSDKDITISKVFDSREEIYGDIEGNNYILTREDVIKSFISYAVACMFGRYSLDEEGLIYAGGNWDDKFRLINDKWELKSQAGWKKSSIDIAEHNVIPITEGAYFTDDILTRLIDIVRACFGEDRLEDNLDYIADSLGQRANETPRQAIRRYFLRDFYKDHVRTYKKRPIYWLFDSGKENGFKALIYMHRYNPHTIARLRVDYLHNLQRAYEAELKHLDTLVASDLSSREKNAAKRQRETISKRIMESRQYDEVIAYMANKQLAIDLDDGVKVNYAKFQKIEIPSSAGKQSIKRDLLAKL
ncbi:MAG TPA: BREX-1 system adenine-specific DNA-methyltransferase PglX, partial [Syntrophomonadaceae bacterium]|nr:BREX-1 system adenine-specific DNA-methyltransferase PglX [Syntrophomonadaceae bacterium]